jgi:hypothetical protein
MLLTRLNKPVKPPIFIVQMGWTRSRRKVKYFLVTGQQGADALQDITGIIGRYTGNGWDCNDGTCHVSGGDGSDVLDSLGIDLFNDHKAIPYYTPH